MFKKLKTFSNKNKNISTFIFLVIITMLFLYFKFINVNDNKVEKITYNEFMKLVYDNKVDKVSYNENNEWMTVFLFNDDTKDLTYEERCSYDNYDIKDKRLVLYPGTK